MPAAEFGRYEVVLDGSAIMEGWEIGAPGFRYVRGEHPAEPLVTGANGATVVFLSFDRDALEGGITGRKAFPSRPPKRWPGQSRESQEAT